MTAPAAPAVGDQAAASWAATLLAYLGGNTTAFTPTLTVVSGGTNPTLGSGSSQLGRYVKVGHLIVGQGTIVFGASGSAAGSGVYLVNLPSAPDAAFGTGALMGMCTLKCAGLFTRGDLWLTASGATVCRLTYTSVAVNGSYVSTAAAAPGAWTAGDSIQYAFQYPAA